MSVAPQEKEPEKEQADPEREKRLRMLRGSIKLMLSIGFLFLLVPFFKSIPWPRTEIPEDAVLLTSADIAEGQSLQLTLNDGSAVFVTRTSASMREALRQFPADELWSASAPGIGEQEWLVFSARSAQDEALHRHATVPGWVGGFASDDGGIWDIAGRALKPGNRHPGSATKIQNLMPLPFRRHDDGILLLPLPPATAAAPDTVP